MIRINHARSILCERTVPPTYPGEGQGVAGDGFVPSRAALLEGATQLAQHVDTHRAAAWTRGAAAWIRAVAAWVNRVAAWPRWVVAWTRRVVIQQVIRSLHLFQYAWSHRLTLDCYHSGGSADPWPRDDWYGAERNVDAWLQVSTLKTVLSGILFWSGC